MTPEISRLDKEITAIHRKLLRLERIDQDAAESWQAAWDKHPALHTQERGLWRRRGLAQEEAAAKALAALMRPTRTPRPKKCPTCGHHTLRAA